MAATNSKYVCRMENDTIKISRIEPVAYTHADPSLKIQFMRTIRVPENAATAAAAASKLPAGLGRFPLSLSKMNSSVIWERRDLRGIEGLMNYFQVARLIKRGVFFPMHENESMWVAFRAKDPFMVKIYAGGVNIVSGEHHDEDADTKSRRQRQRSAGGLVQDYIVVPKQLWVDGIAVSPGVFRQFEAWPSGQEHYTLGVRLTRESFAGELQFEITPHKPFLRAPRSPSRYTQSEETGEHEVLINPMNQVEFSLFCNANDKIRDIKKATKRKVGTRCNDMIFIYGGKRLKNDKTLFDYQHQSGDPIMLVRRGGDEGACFIEDERSVETAAGGTVKQTIVKDWHDPTGWEPENTITIPVHILSPDIYRRVTGRYAPASPVTDQMYLDAGMPLLNLDETQNSCSLRSIIETKQTDAAKLGLDARPPFVQLHGKVADPDDLINHEGPFRPFRTLADLEKDLQGSEPPESSTAERSGCRNDGQNTQG